MARPSSSRWIRRLWSRPAGGPKSTATATSSCGCAPRDRRGACASHDMNSTGVGRMTTTQEPPSTVATEATTQLDPVTFEVLKNSFVNLVDQMSEQMLRTCYSFVI